MHENEEKLEFPYIAIIPYNVMSDQNLSPGAKLHFGCLTALAKKEGYCWATDEQLAEMHEVSIRQIKNWLRELEACGYIIRISESRSYRNENGKLLWKNRREIYVNEAFSKKVCDGEKNFPVDDGEKNFPSINNKSLNNQSIKENILKERRPKSGSPLSSETSFKDSLASSLNQEFLSRLNEYRKSLFLTLEKDKPSWVKYFKTLLNKHSEEHIRKVIKFIFQDTFWRQQIESPNSLTKYFSKLEVRMAESHLRASCEDEIEVHYDNISSNNQTT